MIGFALAAGVAAGPEKKIRSWLSWSAERRLRSIPDIIYIFVSQLKLEGRAITYSKIK